MKCVNPGCGKELDPGDTFCGHCGADVPVQAAAQAAAIETSAPVTSSGSYSAEISRKNPSCLVFLVDQSGSMEEPIAGGGGQKKQVVADAINRLIYNTILRCTKEDGVRPYFDVGVWSYFGNDQVEPAFGADLLSLSDIAEQPKRTEAKQRKVPDGAGSVIEQEFHLPIWFDPVASGRTPMHAAFSAVVAPLQYWISQHAASFPPVVINLTDGAYTDQSPSSVARELARLGTNDGNALVFNCHITQQEGMTVAFPNDSQAAGLQGLARELYDISSPLPATMSRFAQAKGYNVEAGARGYAFNADVVTMIDFLEIGTRVTQDRSETV